MLPFLLIALPAGVWVDRLPRKPILVLGDLGRALALSTIPLAYASTRSTIGHLYVVGFIVGICTVFFDVAYQSYLPSLVTREQLVEGNSKLEISRSGRSSPGRGSAACSSPRSALRTPCSSTPSALPGRAASLRGSAKPSSSSPQLKREHASGACRGSPLSPRRRALARALRCTSQRSTSSRASRSRSSSSMRSACSTGRPRLIGVVFALGNVGWLIGAALASRVSARLGIGRTLVFGGVRERRRVPPHPPGTADEAVPIVSDRDDPHQLRRRALQRHRAQPVSGPDTTANPRPE
jgi:hypothetical protein